MLVSGKHRLFVLVVVTSFFSTSLFGVICGDREYRGKKVMCCYSGLVGVAKACGTQYHARVFTGTVNSAVNVGETDKRLVITPVEAFLGDKKEVIATTNQACLSEQIREGDQWLFYVDRDAHSGELVVSYAGPSKPIASATDEIPMLRGLLQLKDAGMLTGIVEVMTGAADGKTIPLANHGIIARNVKSRETYAARTNQNGYFFVKVPAGSYRLVVPPQGAYHEVESFGSLRGDVPVEQGACWQHDFTVRRVKKVQP